MLSLDNAFDEKDLILFIKKIKKLKADDLTFVCEPKIDGVPISLQFKDYYYFLATTRGDGIKGEKITNCQERLNVKIQKLFMQKQLFENFDLQGEAYIPKAKFIKINQDLTILKEQKLKEKINQIKAELIKLIHSKINNLFIFNDVISNNHPKFYLLVKNPSFLNLKKQLEIKDKIILEFKLIFYGTDFFAKFKLKQLKTLLKQQTKFISQEIKDNEWSLKTTLFLPIKLFINPRNFASGVLRKLDNNLLQKHKLNIMFFNAIFYNQSVADNHFETLQILKKWNLPVVEPFKICHNVDEIKDYIDKLFKKRDDLPYAIDGVVIKVNEYKYYSQLGVNSRFPNYWIAYKFPAEEIETEILDIFATIGRTGRITYNARLKKIFLAGTNVQAAILHNANHIENLDIRLHDIVKVKKSGDIIPKIISVNLELRSKNTVPWKRLLFCPVCKKELVVFSGEVDQYCLNQNCKEKTIQSLVHFVSREVMAIDGLDEANLRTFYDLGLIKNILDIFDLPNKEEQLLILSKKQILKQFGKLSLQKLFQKINLAKNNSLENWLFGFNIRHIGKQNALILAKKFDNIDEIIHAKKEDLIAIPKFGQTMANNIFNFFKIDENLELIEKLKSLGVVLKYQNIDY